MDNFSYNRINIYLKYIFQSRPEFIYSLATGGTLLFDLMPTFTTWFLLSGLFLPLLLNYGIKDFFETLIKGIMHQLFLVSGRSAIDEIASCFSLVSLPFATVVASFLKISHLFLPSVLAVGIESEMTRFIIGELSFTQLIYMTEIGVIILKSDIPLNIKDLFVIFIERTIITLPIITLIANFIFLD